MFDREGKQGRSRGFTLIETVVAMGILGIGLIVILELISHGLRAGKVSEEYTQAIGYARTKMEEIRLADSIAEGEEQGEFDKNFRFTVGVKKIEIISRGLLEEKSQDTNLPIDLYQIQVSVLWGSGSRERSTTIESYRAFKAKEEGQKS
jgi:general secretion pathway protein I